MPALRLSGIYLALGTAAFATVCDQWIFTLPAFTLFGVHIALFDAGSVSAVGPRLFGWPLDSEPGPDGARRGLPRAGLGRGGACCGAAGSAGG